MKNFIYIDHITFAFENSPDPLFEDLTFQLDKSWTCIVGANGSGKTTLLKILCGLLCPDNGSIKIPGKTYYSEQRTDFPPATIESFFNSTSQFTYKLKNTLQIQDEWQHQWNVLSHGERKRCQIAVALNQQPKVLAIDEPSNHLDLYSKNILFNALKSFSGVGLLVSHDRDLMDKLCQRTIFINPPKIDLRKCNYSNAFQEIKRDIKSTNAAYILAKNEVKKLQRKVKDQRRKASSADKKRSKRNISAKDHDAKSKIDLARLSGKDSIEGQLHKRLQSKLSKAQQKQHEMHFTKLQATGINFKIDESGRMFPIIIPSGRIKLGDKKSLLFPELTIQSGDKIGIIGNNGSGKSTFLNHLLKKMYINNDKTIYIPQEITIEESEIIINRIQHYNDEQKGQLMTIISRLGSAPDHILQTTIPSPGEVRKLMLAEGIMLNPTLIIMDEPTNHMDLVSIECVESALNACNCAQILVSHDKTFLNNTINYYWSFLENSGDGYVIVPKFKS